MTMEIDEEGLLGTIGQLRDLFSRCASPEDALGGMKKIIEEVNVVDTDEPDGSIWQNQPLHMVLSRATSEAPKTPLRKIARTEEGHAIIPAQNWKP